MNTEITPSPDNTNTPKHVAQILCNKSPWMITVLGILIILGGMFMIGMPYLSGLVVTWASGVVMLVLAAFIMAQLFTSNSKRGLLWGILTIILLLIAGFYSINQTVAALAIWTFVLGCYFLFMGITRLVVAFSLKGQQGFGWALFNGIVSLILGIIVFALPVASLQLVGLLVGIDLLFTGWIMTVLSLAAKRFQKENCDVCNKL